jgi:hypothetical protein
MRQGGSRLTGEIALMLSVVVEQQVDVEATGSAKVQKTMSKTYAIADLHGRFDLLEMALACIVERADPSATLVTLGDYVDRGPHGRKIIERLMAGLGHDGWRLICLKGNQKTSCGRRAAGCRTSIGGSRTAVARR